jgi:hypothetical protein
MHQLAITQDAQFLSFTRNAKAIPMPDGSTVWGPLKALPHPHGDYTLRQVVIEGPEPGPTEIGGTEPPVVDDDVVKILRTVTACPPEMAADVLASCKAGAIARIDREAEVARLAYITDGAGQALVYRRKSDQARACLAAYDTQNPPPAGMFPALEAEVGITGADVIEVATTVANLETAWGAVADSIEAIRLGAKRDIENPSTTTPGDVAAILAAIVWPTPA